jgi:AraC-like DNA-binding protein
VTDSLTLIDMFVRGIAVGGLMATGLGACRGGVSRDVKITSLATSIVLSAWLITESHTLWQAFGFAYPLLLLAYPTSGMFWLFIVVVFDDRRLSPLTLAPAALLLVTGVFTDLLPPHHRDLMWASRNAAGGLLSLHAVWVIVQGWRGDLLLARRRARALLMGFGGLFGVFLVVVSLVDRLHPMGWWNLLLVGQPYGGMIMAFIALGTANLFMQARGSMFGAGRRAATDNRVEAADGVMLRNLEGVMAAERWRHEGLTITQLAEELGTPEHRLRRLINQRLGHRNFADFLNAHRIAAAKRALADPAQAQTTVAAIAFSLGYGSLGPFNRAFRAATGATPTEWRRQSLGGATDGSP